MLLGLAAAVSACQWFAPRAPARTPNPSDRVNTAAAQTVAAIGTQIALGQNPALASATNTPGAPAVTGTPAPASTAPPDIPVSAAASATASAPTTPALSPTAGPCTNQASFVRDVSVPDGSEMLPRFTFVKTWELKNTGTCAWTPGYSVVFAKHGSAMDGPAATPILASGEIRPGDSVQVSVTLRAPAEPGDYSGDWELRSADNQVFGTGPAAAAPFFVKIKVEEVSFAFANYTCSAHWSSGGANDATLADLPCPGAASGSQGYILPTNHPAMEDGQNREGPGWQVMPRSTGDGVIVGRFPALVVPDHADFRATVSCQPEATGCYVRFKVTYQVDGGPEQPLGEWNEGNDGNVTNIIADLNNVGGKSTAFNFYLYVSGSPDQSRGVWFNPQIVKN